MCSARISEQTAIFSLYSSNLSVFITETGRLLRLTNLAFKSAGYSSVLKRSILHSQFLLDLSICPAKSFLYHNSRAFLDSLCQLHVQPSLTFSSKHLILPHNVNTYCGGRLSVRRIRNFSINTGNDIVTPLAFSNA